MLKNTLNIQSHIKNSEQLQLDDTIDNLYYELIFENEFSQRYMEDLQNL